MTYACEECGFLFYRAGEAMDCPSCNKDRIRPTTCEETQRLHELLKQRLAAFRAREE